MIPYGRQHITEEDIKAVADVLRSDYLTQGPVIPEFETAFAAYVGSKYAVAVANGTGALHLSVLALGLEPGQKVITTPITFAASGNCVRYCGGEVVFSDIDPDTGLLDPDGVEKLLKRHPEGAFAGVIPVDFAGRAVDLEPFRKLADDYGLWILEDACHAPGGYFVDNHGANQKCGNGTYTDLAIFSFHPVKHIAAGEGGMITTDSEALYEKLLLLRTHGITRESDRFQNPVSMADGSAFDRNNPETGENSETEYPGWYMEMQDLGYNYRLTDFQAALGLSQLSRAEEGISRRREIAAVYEEAFEGKEYIRRQTGVVDGHAYHLYVIEVENRLGLYNHLREKGILAQIHYIPLHLMPYYRQFGWKEGDMPQAEAYYSGCISLPMFPALTEEEQEFVIESVEEFYRG
ncbi:MAG: UDP-4-amino-4,6-dideoxy-N-acetyl-beta-L-altrosamine transaminase [Balneolaceae bacterium]